ncbi:tandem-95 repeat protein [Rhodobacteraceae bacterium NNCM2]|nr:tandem-95 repeat protein [Coraliihabitans acroporae]
MTTYNVSSSAELKNALASAKGGDEIVLSAGSYGKLDLNGTNFGSSVTIKSANPGNPAVFDSVSLRGVNNLRIDGVHVDNPGNGVSGARVVNIDAGSKNIEILNSEINGKVDGNYSGFYGIYVGSSSNVTLTNNYVHDVKDGMYAVSSSGIDVVGNTFDYLANDSMKFASVSDVLIENNTGARHVYAGSGAHLDFIQFQGGGSSEIVIRGNVYLPENEFYSQGIFLTPDSVKNVLIEQNIIYVGLTRGITVGSGSNVTVQNNTVLTVPNAGHKAAIIDVPSGSTVKDNVYGFYKGGWSGSNLQAEWDNPGGTYYYDALYENASVGWGITIEDLRPVSGSPVDFGSGVGADERLAELLLGGSGSPGNNRPEADADQATVAEDGDVDINVLKNDSDPDGDNISVTSVGQPAHGTVTINNDGTLNYTPDANYSGTDSFSYTLRDAKGGTDTGQVTITVTQTPDAPVAKNDGATLRSGDSVTINALSNDADPDGGQLTIISHGQPKNGTLTDLGNGQFSYTPNNGFTGTDSFNYTVQDPDGQKDTGTVTFNVLEVGALPTPVFEDDGGTFAGSSNDAQTISHQSGWETSAGTVSFSFTADNVSGMQGLISKDAKYFGTGGHLGILLDGDDLLVRLQDGSSSHEIRATNAVKSGTEYSVALTFGPGGMELWMDGVLKGENSYSGGLTGNREPLVIGANQWSSTNGTSNILEHSFEGEIHDVAIYDQKLDATEIALIAEGGGSTGGSDPVPNTAPVANDDQTSVKSGQSVRANILDNDTDPDGDAISVASVGNAAHGTVKLNTDGTVTYTADDDFSGTDRFSYTIVDARGKTDTGEVEVTVSATNANPVAKDDSFTTTSGGSIILELLANDTDADGDTLSILSLEDPENGTLTDLGDGRVRYTPDDGFTGTERFDYTVTDSKNGSDTATVTVSVQGESDLPAPVVSVPGTTAPGEVEIIDHSADWRQSNGTLSINFTANSLSGTQTLFSKDGHDFGKGGHLTIRLKNGELSVYLQDKETTHTIRLDDEIEAGTEHNIALSFGKNGMQLWLDGVLFAERSYTGGLVGNAEPAIIGGARMDTKDGMLDKITHTFDGVIENVVLYDRQLEPSEIAQLADVVSDPSDTDEPATDTNAAPVANDDSASTEAASSVRIDVVENDTDSDGDTVSVTSLGDPSNGTVKLNGDGTISYTPNAGFAGTDTFTYTVSDGEKTDQATVTVAVSPAATDGAVTVSSLAQLKAALAAAQSGDTILLADGDYGALEIDDLKFSQDVTIRSVNPLGARFTSIDIENTSHLVIDGLHVDNPTDGSPGSAFVDIGKNSSFVSFINSEVNGSIDGQMVGSYGIRVDGGSTDIDVSGNTVHDVEHGAVFFSVSELVVAGNDFDNLGSDSMKFGGVSSVLIENNSGAAITMPAAGDHIDFIQFQGDGTDIVIRGNTLLLEEVTGFPGYPHQGIFLKDGEFNNVLIEQNLIYTNTVNGIYIASDSGTGGNVTIRQNTVLTPPDLTIWGGAEIRMISLAGDYTIEDNVTDRIVDSVGGGTVDGNLILQWEKPSNANHYNSVYANAMAGSDATVEDFLPVSGSAVDQNPNLGANERIAELVDGEAPAGNRAPVARDDAANTTVGEAVTISVLSNDTDSDGDTLSVEELGTASNGSLSLANDGSVLYTPNAGFAGTDTFTYTITDGEAEDTASVSVKVSALNSTTASLIGAATGENDISGRSDVIEIAHNDSLAVDEATIALGFNADTVSGKHGLISKDASYFGGGGNHFVAYLENGVLKVRYQDGSTSETLTASGIKAGQDYEMVTSFGDGKVELWLDGNLVDSANFDTSWETNKEYLQIGANGWASKTGSSGYTDIFDGTISDAVIANGALNPTELSTLVTGMQEEGTLPAPDDNWAFELL